MADLDLGPYGIARSFDDLTRAARTWHEAPAMLAILRRLAEEDDKAASTRGGYLAFGTACIELATEARLLIARVDGPK